MGLPVNIVVDMRTLSISQYVIDICVFWFGCGQQQKRHAAAPPPTAVRRRMERNRQKPEGRDKGSLTEQQTKATATTTVQIRGKHNTNRTAQRAALPNRLRLRSRAASEFSPPRFPPPEPSMTAHGMEYPAPFGQVGVRLPSCVPSWIPVKINPVLAKPRTLSTTYSIPSTSCPGPPVSS